MIRRLAGRSHQVYTGVCLVKKGPEGEADTVVSFYDETDVNVSSMTEKEIREKALFLFADMHLPESVWDSYPFQLSGGMAQRAALARALVNDPELLILDEPLGKLDSLTRLGMQTEIVQLWQRKGFSTLLVTHDVEEALFLAQRIVVLSDRPARVKAVLHNDLPYPRHRSHPKLTELRHEALKLLGLDASW